MSAKKKPYFLKTCPTKLTYAAKFNSNIEEVFKLDLRNLIIENNFNFSHDLLQQFNESPAQALYQSVENVKKIIPNILNIIKLNKDKKLEKHLFLRFKNEDFEESQKKQIAYLENEKIILTSKINKNLKKMRVCENEISNILCDINIITNENKKSPIDQNIAFRKITELKNLLNKKKSERYDLVNNIKILQNKKSKVSKDKNLSEQKLYWHFLCILKEGNDTRKDGLSWVIKEIFEMGKKVIIGYLPKFLDDKGIDYIFSEAKIKMELDELNAKTEKLKNELINKGVLNNIKDTNFKFNEKSYFGINTTKNHNNERNCFSLSKYDDNKKKLKISSTNSNINYTAKNVNIHLEEKKIYTDRDSNSNKNYCTLNEINTINNEDMKNKPKIDNKLNNDKFISNESNNSSNIKDDNSSPYITNKNFYPQKKMNEIDILNESNKIPPIIKLSEIEVLIKENRKNSKNLPMDELSLYHNLLNEKRCIEKQQKENKKKEMDRIFNEYLRNDYYGRYGVEKNVVLSALIGGDNVLPMIHKHIKQARKYFESLKSCSMNPKINDKTILDQLEDEKIKKIVG